MPDEVTFTRSISPTSLTGTDIELFQLRSDGEGDGKTLFGRMAVFNRWTEIDSWLEGHFMESIDTRAFDDVFTNQRSTMQPLYDHGMDNQIGFKPLGPIRNVDSDNIGANYDVELIDTDYNRDFIIPAVRSGIMGNSFRFAPGEDLWNEDPGVSEHNPKGIPEVTRMSFAKVPEFGPTPFPAYAEARAGLRSLPQATVDKLLDGMVERLRAEGLIASGKSHVKPNAAQVALEVVSEQLSKERNTLVRQVMLDQLFGTVH